MTTEWNADAYHRLSDPQYGWGLAVLTRLPLAGDETVIDGGCGSGRVSAAIASRVPRGRVIGLDRSRQMIAAARRTASEQAEGNFHVAAADLTALPLAPCADVVFSTATFHWIHDHPRLFGELFRVLRPGGRLVAQCGGAGNLAQFHAFVQGLMASPEWAPRFRDWQAPWMFATAETTAARLAAAGFTGVETWLEPAPVRFDGPEVYARFVATAVLRTHLAHLPDEGLRARFLAQVTVRAAAASPGFWLDYVRLNLAAQRPGRT